MKLYDYLLHSDALKLSFKTKFEEKVEKAAGVVQ